MEFQVNIIIVDDRDLEDNELLRIFAIPQELPKDYNYYSADVIINDDDGNYKIFIAVNFMFYGSQIFICLTEQNPFIFVLNFLLLL